MAAWCMKNNIFYGKFVTGDIFLGVSSASMFEPFVFFIVSMNMLMLPMGENCRFETPNIALRIFTIDFANLRLQTCASCIYYH